MNLKEGLGLPLAASSSGGSGPPAYEGPLDLYSTGIVGAFGQRALSAAMVGQPLYTLKKMDGGAEPEQSFSSNASGDAPTATISAFLGASQGALVTWDDQSGNGLDSSDPGLGVFWGASVQGGKPGFSGTGVYEPGVQDTPLPNGQCTIFAVCNKNCEMNANLSGQGSAYLSTSGNFPEVFMSSDSNGHAAGGAIDGSGIAVGIHLYEVAWAFGSFSFKVDGTSYPVDDSYDSGGAVASFLTELETRWNSGGILVEWMMFDNLVPAPNGLAISQNLAAYYGITL